MNEKLTEQFAAQEYLNLGGRWDEETFDELMDILAKKEEDPILVRNIFIEQAEGIGERSEIEISPEEKYLYGVLRERPVEQSLSDIRLMAEVFLLSGNIAKWQVLDSKYPNIVFNDEIQSLESKQTGVRQVTYGPRLK